jgi:hypothetical protein
MQNGDTIGAGADTLEIVSGGKGHQASDSARFSPSPTSSWPVHCRRDEREALRRSRGQATRAGQRVQDGGHRPDEHRPSDTDWKAPVLDRITTGWTSRSSCSTRTRPSTVGAPGVSGPGRAGWLDDLSPWSSSFPPGPMIIRTLSRTAAPPMRFGLMISTRWPRSSRTTSSGPCRAPTPCRVRFTVGTISWSGSVAHRHSASGFARSMFSATTVTSAPSARWAPAETGSRCRPGSSACSTTTIRNPTSLITADRRVQAADTLQKFLESTTILRVSG